MKMFSCKSLLPISIAVLCTSFFVSANRAEASSSSRQGSLTNGLIHWWKFNGNGMDSAGDLDLNPIGPIDYVPAVMGSGIDMDGVDTGIAIPDMKDLQFQNSFSISAWAYLRSYPADGKMWSSIIFSGDDRPGLDPYALQVNPSGKMAFLTTGLEDNLSEIQTPFPLKKFVLVTGTYDKQTGTQRLYIDGSMVGQFTEKYKLTPVCALVANEHGGIGIGTNNGFPKSRYNFGWNGIINDLRIYDRSLSAGEIITLYKMGKTGK